MSIEIKYQPNTQEFKDAPIMLGGVGGGEPVRWIYGQYGNYLSVYGINNHISMVFNLNSADDIKHKLKELYELRDNNVIDNVDLQELEERLRLYSTLEIGGNAPRSKAGIQESVAHKKGSIYYTYDESGQKVEHVGKGKRKVVTEKQKKASKENIKLANTPESISKRVKSRNRNKQFSIIDALANKDKK